MRSRPSCGPPQRTLVGLMTEAHEDAVPQAQAAPQPTPAAADRGWYLYGITRRGAVGTIRPERGDGDRGEAESAIDAGRDEDEGGPAQALDCGALAAPVRRGPPPHASRGARRRHRPGAARAGAGRIRAPGTLGGGRPADAAGPLRPYGPRRDRGPAGRLPRAARERRRLPGRATLLCREPGGGTLRI